jgi:hypothetical protein
MELVVIMTTEITIIAIIHWWGVGECVSAETASQGFWWPSLLSVWCMRIRERFCVAGLWRWRAYALPFLLVFLLVLLGLFLRLSSVFREEIFDYPPEGLPRAEGNPSRRLRLRRDLGDYRGFSDSLIRNYFRLSNSISSWNPHLMARRFNLVQFHIGLIIERQSRKVHLLHYVRRCHSS